MAPPYASSCPRAPIHGNSNTKKATNHPNSKKEEKGNNPPRRPPHHHRSENEIHDRRQHRQPGPKGDTGETRGRSPTAAKESKPRQIQSCLLYPTEIKQRWQNQSPGKPRGTQTSQKLRRRRCRERPFRRQETKAAVGAAPSRPPLLATEAPSSTSTTSKT